MTRNSLLSWFIVLVSVGFFASPRGAQAQANKLVLSLGGQLSAGEGNNRILPGIIIDPVDNMNPNGLPTQTLSGGGSSASVAVKVVNPGNFSSPQHYQLVQKVGTQTGNITASIVTFSADSSIKTAIRLQSVLSVTYPSDETSVLNMNLINTGISIQFSDGTRLFECTATPPFPTPPCIVVNPGGFTVTWSSQSAAATFVVGSLILNLADANYDATLTTDIELPGDLVTLTNTTVAQQNGILVNGVANGNQWKHQTFSPQNSVIIPTPGSPDSVTVPMGGDVTPSMMDNGNEIVAFATRRPVALKENVGWTVAPPPDNIEVPFSNEMQLPLKFWIVIGPYPDRVLEANGNLALAQAKFIAERTGVFPVPVQRRPADNTATPNLQLYFALTCNELDTLKKDIGFQPGAVNIYYIGQIDVIIKGERKVDYAVGARCAPDAILMALDAQKDTLAHELGHTMGLGHIGTDDRGLLVPDFDQSNLMWSGTRTGADYLTEGQTFRANLADYSILNLLRLHSGPTRDCETSSQSFASQFIESLACPPVDKRIWADGASQPN